MGPSSSCCVIQLPCIAAFVFISQVSCTVEIRRIPCPWLLLNVYPHYELWFIIHVICAEVCTFHLLTPGMLFICPFTFCCECFMKCCCQLQWYAIARPVSDDTQMHCCFYSCSICVLSEIFHSDGGHGQIKLFFFFYWPYYMGIIATHWSFCCSIISKKWFLL